MLGQQRLEPMGARGQAALGFKVAVVDRLCGSARRGSFLKLLPIALPATLRPVGISRRSDAERSPVGEALMAQMRAIAETIRQQEHEWRDVLKL